MLRQRICREGGKDDMNTVPAPVMMIVFNMYLENGTHESLMTVNRSVKFSNVGFRTKIFGGYWNSSSSGFKQLLMIMTSGSAINTPQIPMIKNRMPFPATERFSFFSLGLKKRYFFFVFVAVFAT